MAKLYRFPPRQAHAMNGISLGSVSDSSSASGSPLHGGTVDPEKNNQYMNKLYELGMEHPAIYETISNAAKDGTLDSGDTTSDSAASSPGFSDQAKLTKHEYPPATDSTYETIDGAGHYNTAFEVDIKGAVQGQSKV